MNKRFPFPTTLHIVGRNVVEGYDYVGSMKEFIDSLVRDLKKKGARTGDLVLPISESAFRDEPPHLKEAMFRAHLGGMAEHLARMSAQHPPSWAEKPPYFLDQPAFFGGSAARERTIAETPAAFRRRLLFCGRVLITLTTALDSRR